MNLYRKITLAFLVLVMTQTAFAQSGKLKGTLQDEKGAAVPYANVAVMAVADSALVTGAVTDAEGAFGISSPEAGMYFLRFSAIGYTTEFSPAFEVSGPGFSKDFGGIVLRKEAALLEEVAVEAMRPQVVVEADKMVVSVEGTAMASGSTAFEVLEKSPGVWIDQDGNLNLNGKSGVKVLIDGRSTYLSAKELQAMLEGMSAENIKNIEIISNPSAKYDAEGTAGVLNINLKRNTLSGLNGSLYAGYEYIQLQGYSTGGNLNYKKGNWNSFVSLDVAERPYYRDTKMYRQFNTEGASTIIDQEGRNEASRFVPSLRLGTEFSLNENHSIGAIAKLSYQDSYKLWETESVFTGTDTSRSFHLNAINTTERDYSSATFNLHYQGALDTTGTSVSADLDYAKINNLADSRFLNSYSFPSSPQQRTDLFTTESPSYFDIYSARVDFVKPFNKDSKLEVGLKGSRVVSDSKLRFFQAEGEQSVFIDSMSNDFLYEENIYAAYASFHHRLNDRWNLQAGLRAEKTDARGFSESLKEETPRKYLNLFPSLFVQQQVSDNYQLSYSYSRRVTRPDYEFMNPAVFYIDPYTFTRGNPYMRPQYTQAFKFTQTLKQTYNLILGYDYTTDFIAEVPEQDPKTKQTYFSIGNVERFKNIGATLVAPVEILPIWSVNNNVVAAYQRFSTRLQGAEVQNERFFFNVQSDHTVKLPQEFLLEVNAFYRGPIAYGVYKLDGLWGVNAGIKRSFMEDKLDLSLNVSDILKTVYVSGSANLEGNLNEFNHYTGARGFSINLRYRFNKGEKFESKSSSLELEELNRAGGN